MEKAESVGGLQEIFEGRTQFDFRAHNVYTSGEELNVEHPEARPTAEDVELDLAVALGASDVTSTQVLTLYIPNKDQVGQDIDDQRTWVLEAADLLAHIGGGVTIMPPVEGGWMNDAAQIIWEQPVVVYTYVKPDAFLERLPQLREFVHRMGRETNQGEVAVEYDQQFFRITEFDPERKR